jgi:hypothetical protein
MARNKKPTWKDVKSILDEKEKSELLKLIADLYSSSAENKSFINARFSVGGQTLEPYRSIISESLYPDVYRNKPISLSKGEKAISDYFKATKNEAGKLELMVHYLETGNQFTADFGDIDEQFYFSLELMFGKILDILRKQPTDIQKKYFTRLENVVSTAINIGWGYHDHISDILSQFETEIENAC